MLPQNHIRRILGSLTTLPEESSADCQLEYVGFANLTWDIPDLRPDLVVVDSGPIEHAQDNLFGGSTLEVPAGERLNLSKDSR